MDSRKKINTLHTKWRKGNCVGQFLHDDFLLKHVTDGRDRSDGKTRKKR
jgi:hypothetical protein